MLWRATTQTEQWIQKKVGSKQSCQDKIVLTGEKGQTVKGFGGCFNELGYIALSKLEEEIKQKVLFDLFDPEEGCKFNFCRMPIGANDYAAEWYSLNEQDEDYNMEQFSIERDRKYLLPYIQEAMKYQPELKLFASPWSPPTWMKFPKVYNNGTIRMEPAVLSAYALYFQKFIEEYQKVGVDVTQIHVQNEVFADQKFPSCKWTSEQLRVFIRDYLGPVFEKEKMDTEIWLGTLNGPEDMSFTMTGMHLDNYNRYIDNILFDEEARKYITGIGYQWSGRTAISRTLESWPEIQLMQTENECGEGRNSWEYAEYVFGLLRHYFKNGVTAYTYWNMVLETGGVSTWGWPQNAMITIDSETKEVIYNPEFYVMKQYSYYIKPGAVRMATTGHWNSMTSVFKNPNGELVIIVQNALNRDQDFTFEGEDKTFTVTLEKNSFNTFVIND
ncbi:MAG: glycoside hydrolase family 30 protein [Mobilitalea sp.]